MKISELITRLEALKAHYRCDGYDDAVASRCAAEIVTDEALYAAAAGEPLDTHGFWNTDTDYVCDFWTMPSPACLQRLHAAADSLKQAIGVSVHLPEPLQ